MIGSQIRHYFIEEKIGEGGMGVVYRARDTRLLRPVALKVLSPRLVSNETNRRRFRQEAQAASALNHPNICIVHDVGERDQIHYIVMEWIDGETLREILLRQKKLPMEQVIEIGITVCDALAAAHARGIIHRDVKPDNIMISRAGQVKVMDFGLAKLASQAAEMPATDQAVSPFAAPQTLLKTTLFSLPGTASYMSPEQIRREALDQRTDIFSLGIVLYELLTGNPPFAGTDSLMMMESILTTDPPPPSRLQPMVSSALDATILKALAKNRDHRHESASTLGAKLEEHSFTAQRQRKRRKYYLAAFTMLGLLLAWVLNSFMPFERLQKSNTGPTNSVQVYPTGLKYRIPEAPSFFPDGEQFLYFDKQAGFGNFLLSSFHIESRQTRFMREIMAGPVFDITVVDVSPEGEKVAFAGHYMEEKGIFVVDTTFVNPSKIVDFGYRPKWSPSGRRITFSSVAPGNIAAENQVFIVDPDRRIPLNVSPENGLNFSYPEWSPDERKIICAGGEGSGWELWLIELATGNAHQLGEHGAWVRSPIWSRDGEAIYFLSNKNGPFDLWQVRIDIDSGTLIGEPEQITRGVDSWDIDISSDGNRAVFSQDVTDCELWHLKLNSDENDVDKERKRLAYDLEAAENIEVSPDGTMLAIESLAGGKRHLRTFSLLDGSELIIYDEQPAFAPSWSADGRWIAFDAGGGNEADIWRVPAAGGQSEKVIDHPGADWMPAYSPGGKRLCFLSNRAGQFDLWVQELENGKATQITNTPENESRGAWSHDGQRLAFYHVPVDTAGSEIRVYDFATKEISPLYRFSEQELRSLIENRVSILNKVIWRADDEALYYCLNDGTNTLMEVSLSTGQVREAMRISDENVIDDRGITIFQNNLYYTSTSIYWEIWIAEGLRR